MIQNTIPFFLTKENIYAVPVLRYTPETAAEVRKAFLYLNPDCVAVELPDTLELQFLHASSRLPDITVVTEEKTDGSSLHYLCEPCDPMFEALRSALERGVIGKCIAQDFDDAPLHNELFPDPYSIFRVGLEKYYRTYERQQSGVKNPDEKPSQSNLYMAKKLKELSFSYNRILFISCMSNTAQILDLIDQKAFPVYPPSGRTPAKVSGLTEESYRETAAEFGRFTQEYEKGRGEASINFPPDKQKVILDLYKEGGVKYEKSTGNSFLGYHLRNTMKFVRNYALISGMLMPDLYKMLSAAKGCVDHNYAYEVWLLATDYPFLKNIDNLPLLNLTVEDVWGKSKIMRFHMKQPGRKKNQFSKRKKDNATIRFEPPSPFGICSYPPEDISIENFGRFLKKKATQLLNEEGARTIPFSTSIEDGLDIRETIRHRYEKKIYVKTSGKPHRGSIGSVVIIFHDDHSENAEAKEKYPWRITWIGEHSQESDMAFYATHMSQNIVGPGISRCEYGGFMMSYPPRRMQDIWNDPDYRECRTKSEVLLMAAIDYSVNRLIAYVAEKPPRGFMKSFAARYGKKIIFIPLGQLSPVTLNKLRTFHVLGNRDKRKIADEYIF